MTPLSNAWAWLISHVRLMIEWAMLAALVMVAGLLLSARIHSANQDLSLAKISSDNKTLADNVAIGAAANATQALAIDTLKGLRAKDSHAIVGLQKDFKKADVRSEAVNAKLSLLEKNNVQAKKLLDTPVPVSVACVLDRRPCPAVAGKNGSGESPAADRLAPAVRAPSDNPDADR